MTGQAEDLGRMPSRLRWARIITSDWIGVLAVSLMFIVKGMSYLPPFNTIEVPSAEHWAPAWAWATVWIVVGVVGVACTATRWGGPVIAGLLVSVLFLWGLMYEYDFVRTALSDAEASRGWANGAVYLAFALILWWSFRRGEPVAPWMIRGGDRGE